MSAEILSISSSLRWIAGRDDVARRLARDLDDIFAEIGLDHLDPGGLEMRVEPDLLRHHGLALGDEARARVSAEPQHDVARVGRRRREMHMPAALDHLPLIGFEIKIEMVERVVLDGARLLAKLVELRQLRERRLRFAMKPRLTFRSAR